MRSIQLLRGTRSVTANGSVGFPFASASHAKKIGARAHYQTFLRYCVTAQANDDIFFDPSPKSPSCHNKRHNNTDMGQVKPTPTLVR